MNNDFYTWRNIRTPCTICRGAGGYMYGSTSTWHGGIGGAAMTWGVCDHCWGSGDAHQPWVDQRKLAADEDTRIHREAARIFVDATNANWNDMHPPIRYVYEQLLKISRQRKAMPRDTSFVARALAKVLAKMINDRLADGEDALDDDEKA